VISAFSSDGRIEAFDLVVLDDPLGAIPPYDAVLLLAPERARDERVHSALAPLIRAIPVELMRAANLLVDRDTAKLSPAQAAEWLAERLHPRER
jgi:osmoprotectant transport system permease protein